METETNEKSKEEPKRPTEQEIHAAALRDVADEVQRLQARNSLLEALNSRTERMLGLSEAGRRGGAEFMGAGEDPVWRLRQLADEIAGVNKQQR